MLDILIGLVIAIIAIRCFPTLSIAIVILSLIFFSYIGYDIYKEEQDAPYEAVANQKITNILNSNLKHLCGKENQYNWRERNSIEKFTYVDWSCGGYYSTVERFDTTSTNYCPYDSACNAWGIRENKLKEAYKWIKKQDQNSRKNN